MKRRNLLIGIAASCPATLIAQGSSSPGAPDVQIAIRSYYDIWQRRDVSRYRTLLTDDYVLLEHGERMSVEDDVRLMPNPGSQRSNVFDFRAVEIVGGVAYTHWFLESKMIDEKGVRSERRVNLRVWSKQCGNSRRVQLEPARESCQHGRRPIPRSG